MFRTFVSLIILFWLVLVACNSNFSNPTVKEGIDAVAITGPDYRYQGKISYESFEGLIVSPTGCEVTYTYFRPSVGSQEVLVILGHGFMRSKKRMERLAQHLASWGYRLLTLNFAIPNFGLGIMIVMVPIWLRYHKK